MHDVIIDDTQNCFIATSQMEQRKEKLKKEAAPKRHRNLSQYLIDWLEKALIIYSLISLDFLIYIGSGSYDMFSTFTILSPEVWYVLAGVLILSIVTIYCLSFFKFLQNLVVSAVVYYFVIAMLNQFAAFDKNTMLASLTATYLSQDLGLLLTHVSHIVVALIIAFLSFIFVSFASKINIFLMLCFLLFCNFAAIFVQLIDSGEHQKFNILKDDVLNAKIESGKNFIYIGIDGLSSYANWDNMVKNLSPNSIDAEAINKTKNLMLGFYAKNGFSFYPHSYVLQEQGSRNFAKILNSNSKKTEDEYLLKNIYPESFWKFNHLNKKDIYMKESRLYDTFKKSKFNIYAYQSTGIELCRINNEMSVHRCVERNSQPIDFENMHLSTAQKVKIILAQWLESTKIFNDLSTLHKILRPFTNTDTLPMVGLSYENMGVKNSLDVLDIVNESLDKTSGNAAYFINIDLPKDSYIYDEYCQIKPTDKWLNKKDLPWIKNANSEEKRIAYTNQLRCVFGKLQEFIDKVNKKTNQKDTVIFIQGISGLNGLEIPKAENTYIDEFMNKNLVDTAVKDPLKKDFQLKNNSCSAADILTQYLYRKKDCPEFDINIDANLKEQFLNQLHSFSLSEESVKKAQKDFDEWYQNWRKRQKNFVPDNIIQSQDKKVQDTKASDVQKGDKEKGSNQKDIKDEKKVEKAPAITAPIAEKPENVTEPLSNKIKESAKNITEKVEEEKKEEDK